MTYNYLVDGNGNLLRNRLYHLRDYAGVTSPTYNNPSGTMSSQMDANNSDLDDQGQFIDASIFEVENDNNYKYDQEGRLIQDLAEGIAQIVWRVDGKVKAVNFTTASNKNNLEFDYDAFGRRIAKHEFTQGNVLVKSTYYVLDAQGNQLSTYEHKPDSEVAYELAERVIYGSSRLGINVKKVDMFSNSEENLLSLYLGNKLYEMSNHLGNVLTVINDIKVPYLDANNDVAFYATIVSTADYSPFGVQLDGRTESAESYRYGYQGQEKDDEIKGAGNSVNYTYRMHDPRLGRFFAVDPLTKDYPWYTPYQFSGNKLIHCKELEGLEEVDAVGYSAHYYRENPSKWKSGDREAFQSYWGATARIPDRPQDNTFWCAAVHNTYNMNSWCYKSIAQRRAYYQFANACLNAKGINCKWYEAASVVTAFNAVGAADRRYGSTKLSNETQNFLSKGNKYLFHHNMRNLKGLFEGTLGSDANTQINDPHGNPISFEGLGGLELDLEMVRYEQTKVQHFIYGYQKKNPNVDMNKIFNEINSSFGSILAPDAIKEVIQEHFTSKGIDFDFSNYEHRVTLGQEMVKKLHSEDSKSE